MLDPNLSAFLGGLWLAVGGIAVWLMLRVYGRRVPTQGRVATVKLHRLLGWVYVCIYLVFLFVMVNKVLTYSTFTALQAVHIAIGVGLLPVLATKILIVRRYPALHRLLPVLGITVFTLSVVIIALGAMPFVIGKLTKPDLDNLDEEQLVAMGETLLEGRCQKCHDLDRVYDQKGKKTKELWEVTMNEMVRLEPTLSDVEKPILAFLQARLAAPDSPEGVALSGAKLVEVRCSKCHSLDRVFRDTKTEEQWELTVQRYAALLPDHIHQNEVEPIVKFLFSKRGAPPDPLAEQRKLFEQHCGRCHNLSTALDHVSPNLSARRWGRTIRKMGKIAVERKLEDVWTKEEAKVVAEYLETLGKQQEESDEDGED